MLDFIYKLPVAAYGFLAGAAVAVLLTLVKRFFGLNPKPYVPTETETVDKFEELLARNRAVGDSKKAN